MEWRIRESSHGGVGGGRGVKEEGGVFSPPCDGWTRRELHLY